MAPWSAASLVFAAWVAALGTAAASMLHLRRLRRHRSPGVRELVESAERASGDKDSVDAVLGELSETVADADRALRLSTMLPRSLARVSLATGTSLAILVLLSRAQGTLPAVVGALLAFLAGMLGAGLCAVFGRQAREEAATARAEWSRHFREATRALGAEVVWTRGRRPR